ncbi:MAG: hypothetical protein ACRDKJ_10415 [Actinomycetota bacterium]
MRSATFGVMRDGTAAVMRLLVFATVVIVGALDAGNVASETGTGATTALVDGDRVRAILALPAMSDAPVYRILDRSRATNPVGRSLSIAPIVALFFSVRTRVGVPASPPDRRTHANRDPPFLG